MKKVIPAVFFQQQLHGEQNGVQKPERLELFESELREVVGGMRVVDTETVTYVFVNGVAYPND